MTKLNQLELFISEQKKRESIGHAGVSYHQASSILTPCGGSLKAFDYSLNPYMGCSFACNYCYAAFFVDSEKERANWGNWVKVKENALQLLMKFRKKPLIGKSIYMSSATDPYQPIERELELTRSLLVELLKYHKVRLVVQTRSPLVAKDIDLYKQFEAIQVNMTVTTDSEDVRKVFEPFCPSNKIRLKAIQQVQEAGIRTCISLSPLLPIENPILFAESLLETGAKKFTISTFHADRGKFAAGTKDEALQLVKKLGWNDQKYQDTIQLLRKHLEIPEGRSGFGTI